MLYLNTNVNMNIIKPCLCSYVSTIRPSFQSTYQNQRIRYKLKEHCHTWYGLNGSDFIEIIKPNLIEKLVLFYLSMRFPQEISLISITSREHPCTHQTFTVRKDNTLYYCRLPKRYTIVGIHSNRLDSKIIRSSSNKDSGQSST